jgi:WG containing repeat
MPVIVRLFPLFLTAFGTLAFCQSGIPTAPEPKEQNGRWGYVNQAGVFVIAPKYFAAQSFADGLALVVTKKPLSPLGREYGEFRLAQVTWIDTSGREIHKPISVRSARNFSDGLAAVVPDSAMRLSGGCARGGYIDAHGYWTIQPKFDGVSDFSEGLAAVNVGAQCGMGGKWGYINTAGSMVVEPRFLVAGQFHNGRACVMEEPHKNAVIDREGTILAGESCP